MEILTLKVTVSEQDLNDLAKRHLPKDVPIEELQIHITPEGLVVKGEYPLLVTVSFETLWELGVSGGKVVARLAKVRTLGMPMTVLKSVVMGVIAQAAKSEPWLAVEKDTVQVDVEDALAREGLKASLNLTAVRCEAATLLIEAGRAEG
ncbi:MAG TPA: hypothetical protein VEL76_30840 [Gemmataceae bacterium]|nr:hypothetical protein [Gemmataceae bacterium]